MTSEKYDQIYDSEHPVQFKEGLCTVQQDNGGNGYIAPHTIAGTNSRYASLSAINIERRRKRLLKGIAIGTGTIIVGSLFGLAVFGYCRGWFTK